uniref:C-type lectin domain-containing protein n=1 Tax=Calidris pygmaea TaxID=425635 RepID=A0A8C3PQP0_9CHAR
SRGCCPGSRPGMGGGQHHPHPEWLFPLPGKWYRLHPVCVLVVAVLVALVLALAVAVAGLSGKGGATASFPAPRSCVPCSLRSPILCPSPLPSPARTLLACPDDWVGYRNVCYYLSRDEGSWEWSQEQCSSRGASLAVLRRKWEMVSEGLLWVRGGLGGILGSVQSMGAKGLPRNLGSAPSGSCGVIREGRISTIGCSVTLQWICQKEAIQL